MENHAGALKDLQQKLEGMMNQFGGTDQLINTTQDLLPKDKFTAEIDGYHLEVSIGLSGKAIVFNFTDADKCASLFSELKQNKQGFFKRIFNVK